MQDESERIVALTLLNRALKEGKSSDETLAQVAPIALRYSDDKRISSAALLLETHRQKLPADFDEKVKAHFDEKMSQALLKANAQKTRVKVVSQDDALPVSPNPTAPVKALNLDELLTRAQKAQRNGRTRSAVALYKRALRQDANNAEALCGIGWEYIDQQNRAGARRVFSRALKASPEYPTALFGMAEAYKESKRYDQAKRYYERFLATSPGGSDARVAKIALEKIEIKLKSLPAPKPKEGAGTKSIEDVLKDNAAALSGEKSDAKDSDTQENSD